MILNLEGVTQAMADRAPAEGLNSITWILRHVLAYRLEALAAVRPSSAPPLAIPTTLPELRAAMEETRSALGQAFEAVEDWQAARPDPARGLPTTLDEVVGLYLVHDAYHMGQLGTARRLLGLPGMIKSPTELVHA